MTQNISDSTLGSRFWTVTDYKVPEDAPGLAPLVSQNPTTRKVKHDSTLTSFANSGGDPMAQSAINRAELFAASHTLSANAIEAEEQKKNTNLERLIGDEAAVTALVNEVADIYASTDEHLTADDVRAFCRTALNKLMVTIDFDRRANIPLEDPDNAPADARRLGPAGLAALKNAMVGLASMLKEGKISESAVVVLADGNYYDAANRADLLRLVADSAQKVKDLFVGADRFDALIKQCRQALEALG
ncbi:MAG: hypothetical protein J6X55_14955, partial [Victivallales bacterium]|nr:hypothetical protein [Victivallales bacterium]